MQNKSDPTGENARLRGDLLTISSRISHDLRTPLGGIVTTTQLLEEILAEKNLPRTLARSILDSVDDMTRLIRQISVIAKASADPKPKKPVNMKEIVARALQRLESRILKKNASIIEPDSWPQLDGVAPWLEEVWWNLLANALQHTTGNPRIELNWHEKDGHFHFEVCDNGGGVPALIQKRLFQSFDSLHEPDSTRGLGLSIVQRLIELQGGKCGYEPKPNGSCFYFVLPAK